MTFTIQLFARARELADAGEVALSLHEGATVAVLRTAIGDRIPALRELLAVSRIAVNHEFATDDVVLRDADEVAVIPPVSGG